MAPGRRTIVSVRVVATLFFAATSVYCLIVASAFAYHQFIRPGLFGWLVWARNQYDALFLGVFSLTLLSLLPDLSQPVERASRWTRGATLGLVGLWGAAALALFVYPVLAVRISEERSLLLAALALVPVAWLAVIDHLACWRTVFRDHTVTVSSEKRIAAAGVAAALYVWAVYALLGAARAGAAGAFDAGLFLGAAGSLGVHLVAFTAIVWTLSAFAGLAGWRRDGAIEFTLALVMFAAWLFALLWLSLLPALALRGAGPTIVAALVAVTMAASWSGMALRLASADHGARSGLEVFFRLCSPPAWRGGTVLLMALLPVVAYAGVALAGVADWGFLVQTSGVQLVWLLSWAAMFEMCRHANGPSRTAMVVGSLTLLGAYQGARFVERRALEGEPALQQLPVLVDRYAIYDASFKTLDDALATRPATTPAFYRYLTANANVEESIPIAPKRVDFGELTRRLKGGGARTSSSSSSTACGRITCRRTTPP